MKPERQSSVPSSTTDSGGAPRLSILIVNFNGAGLLADCLASLRPHLTPDVEVVVVDNGSSDNSREIVAGHPGVKLVVNRENLGFAGGNNAGLPACSGEFILLLNNDTVVPGPVWETLIAHLEARPRVAVVQGKMVLDEEDRRLDCCGSFLTPLGLLYHYGYEKPDGPRYQTSQPVFSAKGACLLFQRSILPEVGGVLFDESFFCYYEETDFCHRVWLAGAEVHFVASPAILHLRGATSGRASRSQLALRLYLRNQLYSLLTLLSVGSVIRLIPPLYAVLVVSAVLNALLLRFDKAGAHLPALLVPFAKTRAILRRRRQLAPLRKVDDAAIFAQCLRRPRVEYFWKSFRGRVREYED